MSERSVFALELDAELYRQFAAEAPAADRSASELVREFMCDFVERRRQARDHVAWFRAEVEQGLREADDPGSPRMAHEDVMASLERMREKFAKKAGAGTG